MTLSRIEDVAAGIVTYNPDLDRLRQNLHAIDPQVSHIYIFDNGSGNAAMVKEAAREYPSASLILGGINHGIAHALNSIMAAARLDGFRYLETLDQDSVASVGMVHELRAAMRSGIAMATPLIVDINRRDGVRGSGPNSIEQRYRNAAARGAITSGALVDLDAVDAVGGFDESLFIDYVDYDLNARLMIAGFTIVRRNRVQLLHEVGKASPTWLITPRRDIEGRWRLDRFHTFGHSEFRCYYKARNRVIYTRRYWRHFMFRNEGVWQIPQQVLLTVAFEDRKIAKLAAFIRGIRDGVRADISMGGLKRPGTS